MVKYKVNLIFKDTSRSLNEIITEVLKIELQSKFKIDYNYLDKNLLLKSIHSSQMKESSNYDE